MFNSIENRVDSKAPNLKLVSGAWVTCLALLFSFLQPFVALAEITTAKKLDVVNLQMSGRSPSASITDLRNGISAIVIPEWRKQGIEFDLIDTTANSLQLSAPLYCSGNQIASLMISIRKTYYEKMALGEAKNRFLVALAPRFGCIWEGISLLAKDANVGGIVILQDTTDPFIVSHELGHALGLGHSNLLQCFSGANDGPWGSDCRGVEYGGAIDFMSNVENYLPLSTYHQWRMGLIPLSDVKENWVDETITLQSVSSRQGTRAVFIRDGQATYWIEFREAAQENGYKPGLVIYRADPPPSRFISSPNPEDSLNITPSNSVSTDIWMLNLDSYKYAQGKVSGSMTLPQSQTFTTFSGNISISASLAAESSKAVIQVTRKRDFIPPRIPIILDREMWNSPNASIISNSYLEAEFDIKEFEVRIGERVEKVKRSETVDWEPTYLRPLSPPARVFVRDLPEGEYMLSVRAIDYSENVGNWSDPIKVFIDRSFPKVSSEFSLDSFNTRVFTFNWNGTLDEGSGLCETRLINEDDFVIQSSNMKVNPKISLPSNISSRVKAEIFDCLGNGIATQISATTSIFPVSRTKKTSKWVVEQEVNGLQRHYCPGSCSASISVSGNFSVISGSGTSEIFLSGKKIGSVSASQSKDPRLGFSGKVASKSQVLRITGKNFSFYGVATHKLSLISRQEILRRELASDFSLQDSNQINLQKRGLSAPDFAGNWNLLPMARGTTLEDPTLDLCAPKFESDSDRIERRQVMVFKDASPYLFLSNEVVRYKSNISANLAFLELERIVNNCRKEGGGIDVSGAFATHTFLDLPETSKVSTSGSKKVFVLVNIGSGSEARSLIGLYQFNQDLFSGLYVVKVGVNSFSEAEVLRWLEVASLIESRLIHTS
jgi:hypothetical protein